jgi:uncharacterized protein
VRRDFFAGSHLQARTRETDMASSHGHFVWYELMTTDMEAAKAFYAEVVGWGTQDKSVPGKAYTLFTAEGTSVGGLMGLPEDARNAGAKPSWIGHVSVGDVDATVERIKQLGGTVYLPPTNITGIGRFSIVADPQMATLALLERLQPGQGQPPDMALRGRVGWHELVDADREKALAFYGELFGWQKGDADTDAFGTYQLFSVEGQTMGGMFAKPPKAGPFWLSPFWLYYFNIGDIDEAAERVKAAGGQILNGPIEVLRGSWIIQCMDPQGAMFALEGKRSHDGIGYFESADSRARRPV